MTDPVELALARRKVRDRSIALLLVGTALLMPPLVGVSLVAGKIAGLPAPLVYVSVVWAALIAGAAALARPLRNTENTENAETSASSGNASDDAG